MITFENREDKIDKSINNSFEQSLVDNGYKWFPDSWKNSIRGFQKKITDSVGIKYFITGYHYNHGKQLERTDLPDHDAYMFDCQFTLFESTQSQTIDIRFSADFNENKFREITTLKEVEDFYEKFWNNFECEYYEKYS